MAQPDKLVKREGKEIIPTLGIVLGAVFLIQQVLFKSLLCTRHCTMCCDTRDEKTDISSVASRSYSPVGRIDFFKHFILFYLFRYLNTLL